MKKLFVVWFAVCVCLLLAGCHGGNEVIPELEKSYESFTAHLEHFSITITRSHLADGQKVLWDEGDSIGVFSDKQGVGKYIYSNGTFQGERIEGKEFRAFYPYKEDAIDPENPNLIHARLHYREDYKKGTFSRPVPMVAISENNELNFMQTCGILHFSIKGSGYLDKVYLYANDESELLCGNGVIDLLEETPILKMVADDEELRNRMDYWVEDYLSPEEPLDLYFIVPVGVYKKGIRLQMIGTNPTTGEELKFDKVTENAVEVRRAVINSYSVVDYDELLQEEMDYRLQERQALMDFYNATDGAHWVRNDNWGSDKPLNEWYGVTSFDNAHVEVLYLEKNGLKGEIPASIGDLKYLFYLNLYGNELSGELPETMGYLSKLTTLYLQENQLTGTIPDSFVNLSKLDALNLDRNHMDGILSETLMKSDWWNNLIKKSYCQADGYKLKYAWLYESSDFSEDGKVVQLQAHTVGSGIPIVITSEAYSDRMMDKFEKQAREIMEALFDLEPLTTFRSCFDVYMVKAVSRNEVLGEDVVFSTGLQHEMDSYNTNKDLVTGYLHKVPAFAKEFGNGVGIVLIHGCGRSYCSFRGAASNAIAYCIEGEKYTFQHEVCGHGIGILADEYCVDDPTGNTRFTDYAALDYDHQTGRRLNVDYDSNPLTVLWRDFIDNKDYVVEGIGIYEGAWARYSKGIYRSTEQSIMHNQQKSQRFNAPSRWAVYQHIMQLAGLEYTFEDFLEYDKKNLEEIALKAKSKNYVEVQESPYQQLLQAGRYQAWR